MLAIKSSDYDIFTYDFISKLNDGSINELYEKTNDFDICNRNLKFKSRYLKPLPRPKNEL